jgi:hypothetical protein
MTDIQTMTHAASSSKEADDRVKALRFTPLRSHVIARSKSGENRGEALSRIIPKRRFQN